MMAKHGELRATSRDKLYAAYLEARARSAAAWTAYEQAPSEERGEKLRVALNAMQEKDEAYIQWDRSF